ncbi:MAG: V-type ATP synthase subunit E family protein [Verrucomicrobiota bacterium]|jgi:vacuolar-type H+-ATPase subunit E/Vma4
MATPNSNSPEVLSGEILAEAGRECDEILRRAQRAAESLLAAAKAEADKIRLEMLNVARAEAARRSELLLATVPVEAGRLRAARLEAILENIREAARRQLRSRHSDGPESVVALAAEAIRRMPGTDFVLKLSAADHAAFGDKLAGEICQRAGRSPLKLAIAADPTVASGGVIVQDANGLRIWDNRLPSRFERLWPELRRQIAVRTALVDKSVPTGGAA